MAKKRKIKRRPKSKFPKWLKKYYQLRGQGKSKKTAYKEAGAPKHYWE